MPHLNISKLNNPPQKFLQQESSFPKQDLLQNFLLYFSQQKHSEMISSPISTRRAFVAGRVTDCCDAHPPGKFDPHSSSVHGVNPPGSMNKK